ncbi:uncharacterized protein LOC143345562 isoform X27 [Colletes latitarsis]|uniref:uncharacterized protein LOC143345562 isoform X27 n=1 Tax=Colletes latitarsis TaxID=2605962 RepID=UPI004036DBD0
MSSLDYLDLCRLCLVKDRVSVPIFDGEGDVRQIFLKIAACLPVKVAREDKLPKKICDDCVYKVELFYQFWNTTVNAEKQLLQWLGEVGMEGKQGYVTNVLNPNVMKQEQSTENRLDGSVMQQVSEHQNNMGIGMMDNIGLGIPMIISNTNQQQQITSVPMDTSSNSAQNVQAVPGPSSQTTHNQISQNQTSSTQQEEEEESSEDEENSDDECDGDEGLPVKEESEEDPNSRTIEPTTFVNVSLACDEAGPSGLQQQKIADMPEIPMPQTADGDPKSGQWIDDHDELTNCEEFRIKSEDVLLDPGQKFESNEKACDLCQEKFHFVTRLVAHLRIVHGIHRPFKCVTCGKTYPQQFMLNAHVKKSHTPKTIPCVQCSFMGVNSIDVERHAKRHHREIKFTCEICSENFVDKDSLMTHTTMHNFMQYQQCNACGSIFNDVYSLKEHNQLYHYHPTALMQEKLEEGDQQALAHKCDVCGKVYKYKSVLKQHKVKAHGDTPSYERRRYLCALCGKELKTAKGLEIHNRSHTGEKPYTCEVCGKCFACETLLRTHNVTHTGERKYSCDQCGKAFTQRSTLVVHKRYHTGERPYVCTRCGKGFVTRTVLNTHMKSCR